MKKVVVSLVGAAALATITAGMAASTHSTVASQNSVKDFFNNDAAGAYVAANIGVGHVNSKSKRFAFNGVSLNKKDNTGFAYNVNLGYQFNPYFAVETGYISFFNHKAKHTAAFPADTTVSMSGVDLVAKGILPVNDQISAFAKAGVMRLSTENSTTTAGVSTVTDGHRYVPVFGLGAAYNINKQVAFNVETLYTAGVKSTHKKPSVAQATAVLAGVSYKFAAI